MILAMEEDEQVLLSTAASPVRDTDSVVSPMSPGQGIVELPANNEEKCEMDIIEEVRAKMLELANNRSSVGSSSKVKHTSTSSKSSITEPDDSLLDDTSPTSWLSLNTLPSVPTSGRINHTRMRSEQLLFGGLIDGRTLDDGTWPNDSDQAEKQVVHHTRFYSDEYGHPRVIEAVSSAMQHLRDLRHQEHISRPIRFEPQNRLHRPTAEMLKIFEASVNDRLHVSRLTTRDWLRAATWWLLKVSSSCKTNRCNIY